MATELQKSLFESQTMTDDTNTAEANAEFQEGLALHHQGQLTQAQDCYQQVLVLQPKHFDALHLLGVIAAQSQNLEQAIELMTQAANVNAANPMVWFNLGNALSDLLRFAEAMASYDKAIALNPKYFAAHSRLGLALRMSKQYYAAIDSYTRAIVIESDYYDAYIERGLTYLEVNNYRHALSDFEYVLTKKTDDTNVIEHRNNALVKFRKHQEIIGNYYSGPYKKPKLAIDYCRQGDLIYKQKKYEIAIHYYDEALAIKSDYAEAFFGRGNVMAALSDYKSAVDSYDKAIVCKPNFASAHYNCGTSLNILKQYQDAIDSFSQAIKVEELAADAYAGRGGAHLELENYLEAVSDFDHTFSINPEYECYLKGQLLYAKLRICDWLDISTSISDQKNSILNGKKVSSPFSILAIDDSIKNQLRVSSTYANDVYPANYQLLKPQPTKFAHKKIRIAYCSMDFRNHPVAYLTAELFEIHDRTRFEIFAFSFGPKKIDEMRMRLELAFDRFVDVTEKSDLEIAKLARDLEIDIMVDLAGFTHGCRTGIFALRAAPVQVSYLGFPGTMGVEYIDYIIGDEQLIPSEYRFCYSEKVVYLPTYQVNDRKKKISEINFRKTDFSIPDDAFVFCCFNSNFKITPSTFDGWCRILNQTENSVLFLLSDNELAVSNLKKEAAERGVDPGRLIFGEKLPISEYLARFKVADLFLDTFPYNAGTTASDALWAGLPLLTRCGEAFASRMASSLLMSIGMSEMICESQEIFEEKAIQLGRNPHEVVNLKEKLAINRTKSPLFDTDLFAKSIEAAFSEMHTRYLNGLPPDHIFVKTAK